MSMCNCDVCNVCALVCGKHSFSKSLHKFKSSVSSAWGIINVSGEVGGAGIFPVESRGAVTSFKKLKHLKYVHVDDFFTPPGAPERIFNFILLYSR